MIPFVELKVEEVNCDSQLLSLPAIEAVCPSIKRMKSQSKSSTDSQTGHQVYEITAKSVVSFIQAILS